MFFTVFSDVINVSGHRLSTAEIESALILFPGVAEAAVIGANDELTGQAVYAFVTLKPEFKFDGSDESGLIKELTLQVRKVIGPFAAPKKIFIVADLPKTRSGKVRLRVCVCMCAVSTIVDERATCRSCAVSCARSLRARATSWAT